MNVIADLSGYTLVLSTPIHCTHYTNSASEALMEDRWTFPEEPHYDMDFAAIKFVAECGTKRHVCAISTAAINNQFRTEDTRCGGTSAI